MSAEEHAQTIEEQMRADMLTTLKRNGMNVADETWLSIIVDELVMDAMHQVEQILTKVDWDD